MFAAPFMRRLTVPWQQPLVLLLISFRFVQAQDEFDAIIIGAGGGGCPLAQTLLDKGKRVLLLERGGRANSDSDSKATVFDVLTSTKCLEIFDGDGVVMATGNCLGGATSWNQGVWIEEVPDFLNEFGSMFSEEKVESAYAWVREQIAPVQQQPAGSEQQIYLDELIRATNAATGIPIANVTPGTPSLQVDGIWKTHSIFQPDTKQRRSAEFLLNKNHPNLDLRLHTEVSRIVIDKSTLTAQCVIVKDGPKICVKGGIGRIYLAAGAIHTPRLLIQSQIGPKGDIYDNPHVGKHFSDKPFFANIGFFQSGFEFSDGYPTVLDVAYTKTTTLSSGNERLLLHEELSTASDGDLIDFGRFERVLLPRCLRFSFLWSLFDIVLGFCDNQLVDGGFLGLLCAPFIPFYNEGCTANAVGLGSLVADPSSKGEVTVRNDGSVKIDPGYLANDDDIEALGAAIRLTFPIFAERSGPSSAAEADDTCNRIYCLYQNIFALVSFSFNALGYRSAQVNPNWLKPDLETKNDKEIGEKAKKWIISPHHFAGTAAVGRVVENNFKVIGVEGLYVADASVLPTTPRVNSMASAMMIGRLAGMAFD